MAYRPLFEDGVVFDLNYFTIGNDHVVTLAIGEDDGPPPRVYSIMLTLSARFWLGAGVYEFTFSVVEYDVELDAEHVYWSGLDTKPKITEQHHRAQCLDFICVCLDALLAEGRPDRVFMQAHDANLPVRARAKYERVMEIFVSAGYSLERQPAYHGRDSWWMERTTA